MTSSKGPSISTDEKPPVLFKGGYDAWKNQFIDFIDRNVLGDYIRKSLKEGIMTPPTKLLTLAGENGQDEQREYKLPLDMYSGEQRKRHEADKLARSFLMEGMSKEISKEIFFTLDIKDATGKLFWEHIEKIETGPKLFSRVKFLEFENSELKEKISALNAQIQKLDSVENNENVNDLESTNVDLQKKISDLEKKMDKERSEFEIEKKAFIKKFSDFSRKCADEKKAVELKCLRLSQKVSEFEKVIILEREKFVKEKKEIEQKNVGFFKEISGQRNNAEKGFKEERSVFEAEIKKLTAKLSELSEKALKEQKTKSEFTKKIDLLVQERDNFASMIKVLEKSVSRSNQKPVSSQSSVKSFDQIRKTNLFYDRNIDGSGTRPRRRRYKDEELVWKKKPVEDELKERKSCVHASNAKKNKSSKGKPDHIYSRDQLLRLSGGVKVERCFKDHIFMTLSLTSRDVRLYSKVVYCWELKNLPSMVNAAGSELLLLEDFKVNTASRINTASQKLILVENSSLTSGIRAKLSQKHLFIMENLTESSSTLVSKVPMLKPSEFDMWKIRIRKYILLTDYSMWDIIENGPSEAGRIGPDGKRPPPKTDGERKIRQTEMKALSTLLLSIPNEYQHQFCNCTDAQILWNALEKRFAGTKSIKRNQRDVLKQQYENFTSSKNESMTQTFDRFNKLIGELATVGVKMEQDDVNRKFLRSLGDEWTMYTVSYRQSDNLEEKELDDLYNDLRVFETEVETKKKPTGYIHNAALLSASTDTTANPEAVSTASGVSSEKGTETIFEAFLSSHSNNSLINDDLDQLHPDDLEEMDIKWQMAMLSMRVKKFIKRTGRNNFSQRRENGASFDKTKVECYKCHMKGHFARECRSVVPNNNHQQAQNGGYNQNKNPAQALVSQQGMGFDWSDQAEEAIQNQALMAEVSDLPSEIRKGQKRLCLIVERFEEQIKGFQANELQHSYDTNYWKWEKNELETKLSKSLEESDRLKEELSKVKLDIEKFSYASKAMDSLLKAQIHDKMKPGIGYNNTPPPYNNNYISPTSDLLETKEKKDLSEKAFKIDPLDEVVIKDLTEKEASEYRYNDVSKEIPLENNIITNEGCGKILVKSKEIEKTKGKDNKVHYKQTTVVNPGSCKQCACSKAKSLNSGLKRGNQRNWNNQWAQKQGVDLSKINRPKPCFICGKLNHLAKYCFFNPTNQQMTFQRFVQKPVGYRKDGKKHVIKKHGESKGPMKKKILKASVKMWVPRSTKTVSTADRVSAAGSITAATCVSTAENINAANTVSTSSKVNTAKTVTAANTVTTSNKVSTAKHASAAKAVSTSKTSTVSSKNVSKPIIVTKYSKNEELKFKNLGNQQLKGKSIWHVDSGCSRHMTSNMSCLQDFKHINGGHVAFGDNLTGGKISGKGNVTKGKMTFEDVYYVDQLKYNLLSVSQVCDKQHSILFTNTECMILAPGFKVVDESMILLRTPRKDNVYCLDMDNVDSDSSLNCLVSKSSVDESSLWHRRMCHINFKTMNKLVKNNLVRGLPSKLFSCDDHCVACIKGKQHKTSHKTKEINSISSCLQLLHMDLFGPTNVMSIGKKSYCLVIVDDYSRFTWVYFLRTKDETSGLIKSFILRIENQTNQKVKVIRSDNGTEFKNLDLNTFCEEKGIERQYSAPRTPQKNGVAERRNRTLIEAARSLLADSKLPITFWAEAVNTACYVQNRVLVVKPKNKTPYELLNKRKPFIGFFKPFGCPCIILNTKSHLGKFDSKADDGLLVGYSSQSKAYRVFNSSSRIIEENDNVKSNENTPNPIGTGPQWLFDIDSLTNSFGFSSDYAGSGSGGSGTTQVQESISKSVIFPIPTVNSVEDCEKEPSTRPSQSEEEIRDEETQENKESEVAAENTSVELHDSNLEAGLNEEPSHNTRVQKNHPPQLVIGDISSPMMTRHQSRLQEMQDQQHTVLSCFLSQLEPKKAHDAMKESSWIEAMQEELLQNKRDERGIVIRNKARLVAQGYTQEEGIDYEEVFAPVARIEAIILFLAYASYMNFKFYQVDVKSAFLYGSIEEEVYVCQPPGFENPSYPDRVYKLKKALYGLHQAPRAWYDTLSSYLLENGFERGVIDKTLFIKRKKKDILLVQIYVDDIIFGSTRDNMCKEFEELMHQRFKMSSMGELTFFLGLQVQQKSDGIFICQSKYVQDILTKFGFSDSKPAITPMETHKQITADLEGEDMDVHHYRSMIGSLMYLTASRPDIMFPVCVCARFQVRPKQSHFQAVKRIFRYLKGQPRLGLWYPHDSPFDLIAYSDSDLGGANLDRKSTSGGCQFLGARLVSWQCKKQTTMSTSTTEAEYIAAASCCSQVLWIQNQMLDYGVTFLHTPIFIDNSSAISIVNNPVKHSKTKHIEIRYHFIRDCNEKKLIQVVKVHTDNQFADLFTKAFDVGRFTFLVTSVGMINSE
ncbi:hypothetical protein L6452_15192 [Arctium lappa]|uniref:Uncharacterized protein n=1 Tax=Arctium lappa TaxID=4217 RepID=A0ACB9CN29_ARCLA|nr:hypothetical protein L6452_15192 [Arctium lappa]